MGDTSPQMDQKMREMIRMKSPAERFRMGCSMFESSKILVCLSICKRCPNISSADLRKELFMKFYGKDFDVVQRKKILKHLGSFEQ